MLICQNSFEFLTTKKNKTYSISLKALCLKKTQNKDAKIGHPAKADISVTVELSRSSIFLNKCNFLTQN